MKKIFVFLLLSVCTTNISFGQALSDSEVLKMAVREKKTGASESEIASRLIQKGATMDQIQRIRSQYAKQITKNGMDSNVDNAIGSVKDRMRVNNEVSDNDITTH